MISSSLENNYFRLKKVLLLTSGSASLKTVIFLGEKGCGKTTLVQAFNGSEAKSMPKSTVALQFSYAKKKSDAKKECANIYELGGG